MNFHSNEDYYMGETDLTDISKRGVLLDPQDNKTDLFSDSSLSGSTLGMSNDQLSDRFIPCRSTLDEADYFMNHNGERTPSPDSPSQEQTQHQNYRQVLEDQLFGD